MSPLLTINRKLLQFHSMGKLGAGKRIFLHNVLCLLVTVAFLTVLVAPPVRGDVTMPNLPNGKKRKEALPPQAISVTTQTTPNGTVQIPLRIYGREGRTVNYLIRNKPKLGRILGIQPIDQETSLLTYQHTSKMGVDDLHDKIVFAAQDTNGTSAPAVIDITIVDVAPLLTAPENVDFGDLTIGETVSRLITLSNRGGHVLEGDFGVEKPWQIEPNHYRITRGQSETFKVSITPQAEQEYLGHLGYPDSEGVETTLHAAAFAPITATPSHIDLLNNGLIRSGKVTLSNRTSVEQNVTVEASPRLHLPPIITIPANGTISVKIAIGKDDLEVIDETISFHEGASLQTVKVHALSVGPWLQIEPQTLAFGTLEVGRSKILTLHVSNLSGDDVTLTSEVTAPFQLEHGTFTVPAKSKVDVTVNLSPAWAGTLSDKMTIHLSGTDMLIPLSAEVTPRTPVVQQTAPAPPKKQDPLSDVPPVHGIQVGRITSTTAELSWPAPIEGPLQDQLTYRIDVRRFTLDENGSIHPVWIPLPTVEYTKTNGNVTALLSKIPPSTGVAMHVVSINPKGEISEPSSLLQFFTLKKIVIFTWQRALLAFFGLMLIGTLWFKKVQARTRQY